MAEFNFGLLTPPGSQSIGNAFTQGMDQAQESRARDLQMQQSVRKGQMDELTYRKALDTEARLNKYYSNIAANGGPKTPEEAIQAMLGSGVPHIQDLAAKLQIETLKNDQQLALYRAAKAGPATTPTAVAAPMAPEPGSFGADVAARRAADMFAPPPVAERTNMMPGAAASVNNMGGRSVAEMIAERDRMLEIPGKFAEHRVTSLNADILRASKPPHTQTVDGQVVERQPDGTYSVVFGEKKQPPIVELQALLATMPPNDPRRPALQAEVEKALTMQNQGAGRLSVSRAGLALRNRELDPYGMNPPITAGGAPVNALPAQPRPTVNALPAQVSGAAPVAPAVAPAGAAPKMTVADAFQRGVTGQEFVAVLPPTVKPLVESILRYDQRPPSAATKRGQQILELVNQADPTYDAGKAQTRYIAKQTFVKGPVADSIASSNTAIDHMDTLAKYGADLNNTDVRLVNAAKQGIAAAFGANAPTTFDATRKIVGQEVVKAVVANGGSMREREEAADAFSRANSPAQLAGVIKSYQALLSGRLKSTQLRYENDTGLTDFQTKLTPATIRALNSGAATPAAAYVETKTLPDGRVVGKKADGSLEVVK